MCFFFFYFLINRLKPCMVVPNMSWQIVLIVIAEVCGISSSPIFRFLNDNLFNFLWGWMILFNSELVSRVNFSWLVCMITKPVNLIPKFLLIFARGRPFEVSNVLPFFPWEFIPKFKDLIWYLTPQCRLIMTDIAIRDVINTLHNYTILILVYTILTFQARRNSWWMEEWCLWIYL